MLRKKNLKYGLMCLLALLLAGCGDETSETVSATTGITFQLMLPGSLEVDTRASSIVGTVTVEDVWVVQYNATENSFLNSMKFDGGDGIPGLNNNILTFSTSEASFSQLESRFYVIVNAGANFLDGFSGSEDELKAKKVAIPSNDLTGLKLLTSGPITYTPSNDGKVKVVAPLFRAYAQVTVIWNDGDSKGTFAINQMTIRNYPNHMALYARGGGALGTNYPIAADINATAPATIGSMTSGKGKTFLIPENMRGMGTAPSFADKGLAKYGPGGSLAGCTNILLEGTYQYEKYLADGTGLSDPIDVAYCIYLGTNLSTDYNIQRNYDYTVTLNLSGANSGDVRVQITDGKVVVFDKVDKIEHNIEFLR